MTIDWIDENGEYRMDTYLWNGEKYVLADPEELIERSKNDKRYTNEELQAMVEELVRQYKNPSEIN